MKPQGFLKHGDVVDVEIGGIGWLSNKMVFL
jgi:2-keto-4-pentenoate hydratase/2-oxohepta-3-ene-1,7-dioic acid hydratase in catechol pathway